MLLGAGLLTGCGDDSGSTDGASEAGSSDADGELLAWVEELEAGQSTLTLSGTVTSEGENPHDSAATEDSFRPAAGGGASRRGSNADGPYSLSLYTDAIHEDGPDTRTRARVSLVLPTDAEAGRTYEIAAFRDAEDDQVQSQVQDTGMDWIFARDVTGQLYLAELGGRVSAAWRLEAADGGGEEADRVEVEGAVAELAFSPQREARYEIIVNGDDESHLGRFGLNETPSDISLSIGNGIYLSLPTDLEPGDYDLADRGDDGGIGVNLTDHDVESIEGTMSLSEGARGLDAELAFEASGQDEVRLTGHLENIDIET